MEPRILSKWEDLKSPSVILICLVFGFDLDTEQQREKNNPLLHCLSEQELDLSEEIFTLFNATVSTVVPVI